MQSEKWTSVEFFSKLPWRMISNSHRTTFTLSFGALRAIYKLSEFNSHYDSIKIKTTFLVATDKSDTKSGFE